MVNARPNCLRLLMHAVRCAFSLALDNAGSNMAARIAMMAMTTSSSINVNPPARSSSERDLTFWCRSDFMELQVHGVHALTLDIQTGQTSDRPPRPHP